VSTVHALLKFLGKVHFTPLMYPPIGNLTPNV
jgi:hypothetical protein